MIFVCLTGVGKFIFTLPFNFFNLILFMKKIIYNIKDSLLHIPYTIKHIKAIYKLQIKYIGYIKFPLHDVDKLFMYVFLSFIGTKNISKIHRRLSKHHLDNHKTHTKDNILEAVIDWESARYTKADKPLNAWHTCINYYPQWKGSVSEILNEYNIPK